MCGKTSARRSAEAWAGIMQSTSGTCCVQRKLPPVPRLHHTPVGARLAVAAARYGQRPQQVAQLLHVELAAAHALLDLCGRAATRGGGGDGSGARCRNQQRTARV